MKGVIILEKHILYNPNPICWFMIISGYFMLFVLFYYHFFRLNGDFETSFKIFAIEIIIICIIVLIGIIGLGTTKGSPTNQARYIIRIEDKIDVNELLNNYKIISHEKYSNIYEIEGDIIK